MKEMLSGIIKKFEVFGEFYKYDETDIDFKTRIDNWEIEDITYLHTLHDYWKENFNYESPLFKHLERKKRLRVSKDGLGRKEMSEILREAVQENDGSRSRWDKLFGRNQ
jgi:hypothetical protein